jgi:hypothetical protein
VSGEPASTAWFVKAVGCATVVVGLLWILTFFVGRALQPLAVIGKTVTCRANVQQMTRAFGIYAEDWQGQLPPSDRWMDRTAGYVDTPDRFHCPSVAKPGAPEYGYAMNSRVAGKNRETMRDADRAELVYDSSNLARNASDAVASLPIPPRHQARAGKGQPLTSGNVMGFVNGSVKLVKPKAGAANKSNP